MFLVDSHCHLHLMNLANFSEMSAVLERAHAEGVHHFLNVSVSLAEYDELVKIATAFDEVNISVGQHPNETVEIDADQLIACANHPKVIAIGETGLDYFRSQGDLTWQQNRFRMHVAVAKQKKLPLIVHTRNAREDTIQILADEKASEVSGVMHCFTEDWDTAKKALDLNFYISFSGIVTFKNALEIQAVARKVPLDRILIETDCPYLAPMPHRGKLNEPAFVHHTAEFLANLRNESINTLADATTTNFFNLFKGAVKTHV